MTALPLVLDLFSGTGSATQPFVECGKHRVVRIDINPKCHPDIVADVRRLPLDSELIVDGITAGSPCDHLTDVPWHEDLRTPALGVELFEAAAKAVRLFNPRWWVLENVRGAQKYVGKATCHRGSRYIWTNIPILSPVKVFGKWRLPPSIDRKMLRSEWGLLGKAVHRAVCP